MFCQKCGNQILKNDEPCSNCGSYIEYNASTPQEVVIEEHSFLFYMFQPFRKYAQFSGRARRKEFFGFCLLAYVGSIPFIYLIAYMQHVPMWIFQAIVFFLFFLPLLATLVRRLHDTDHSGLWYFLIIAPIFNIYLMYILLLDSHPGANKYGQCPKRLKIFESNQQQDSNSSSTTLLILRVIVITLLVIVGIMILMLVIPSFGDFVYKFFM